MPNHPVNRRRFIGTAIAAATLPAVLHPRYALGQSAYAPPVSSRRKYNLNLDWKFLKEDVSGAEGASFDDSKWASISLPHSFNDVDSFRVLIQHSGGDRGMYKGLAWYRKHFRMPVLNAGQRVFLEFEGMRQ